MLTAGGGRTAIAAVFRRRRRRCCHSGQFMDRPIGYTVTVMVAVLYGGQDTRPKGLFRRHWLPVDGHNFVACKSNFAPIQYRYFN
jgi:hypothetical protein